MKPRREAVQRLERRSLVARRFGDSLRLRGLKPIGVKLSKFGKLQFVNLARVAPPALRRRPQFWGECLGIGHFA